MAKSAVERAALPGCLQAVPGGMNVGATAGRFAGPVEADRAVGPTHDPDQICFARLLPAGDASPNRAVFRRRSRSV